MKARWKVILDGAREEALLAVDLYNQPRQPRRLEGFLVHMHIAWLYLLQAEFQRSGVDFRYRLPNGRIERVDGEPKAWELSRCVQERFPVDGPVRKNLELTIALRNRIEHRYHESIALVTSGYAQALLLNFEEELISEFGPTASLGNQLRFPVFVGAITGVGRTRLEELRDELPTSTRDFLARFESDLEAKITNDQRYEFRIALVPKLGPKTDADRALTFVRENELSEEQRGVLEQLGRSGSVYVRERVRPVSGAGMLRPGQVVQQVNERSKFRFHMGHFTRAWKAIECRPAPRSAHPEQTDERYCVYDQPHGDYLYTPAFVDRVVREITTAKKFEKFLGLPAVKKPKA